MRAVMKSKLMLVAMAAVVLAVVVAPVAIAGADGAGKSAAPGGKAIKQLKKQVRALQQQIAALEGKKGPATLPPSGPAAGDLTGAFPNPLIGPDAVGAAEIQANAVGGQEIADDSVTAPDIKEGAVDASEIANFAVRSNEIANLEVTGAKLDTASVGGRALQPTIAVVGPGVTVSAGTPKVTSVTCPDDRQLIAGGFGWTDKEESTILASAPSEGSPTTTWTVEGMVDSGSNGLFAWASCLAK